MADPENLGTADETALISGFGFHQYADDSQIYFATRPNSVSEDFEALRSCTERFRCWFLINGLMLNPDKSEALFVGTHQQRHAVASVQTVPVAGADLPIALELKSLGVTIDPQLSFESHVREVCRACNFHLRALSHIRNLLSFQVAQTLACSIVCSRLDYCNSVLYGAPNKSISKLQRIQNNLARIVLQVPRRTHAPPLLHQLHWLPVEQRVVYKLALITFKARAQSTPSYLHNLLTARNCTRTLRSSDLPLLYIPRVRTVTAGRAFRAAAPSIWNTLPRPVSSCDNITSFKRRLKTHLFTTVFKQSLHVI